MTQLEIKTTINALLAGEQLSWKMMLPHINWAIDRINSDLNAIFPNVTVESTEYTAFPDRWIRSVVIPGAIHHYYMVDDEGSTGEVDFNNQFLNGLFLMLRDYSSAIPEEYQGDAGQGSIEDKDWGLTGIWI